MKRWRELRTLRLEHRGGGRSAPDDPHSGPGRRQAGSRDTPGTVGRLGQRTDASPGRRELPAQQPQNLPAALLPAHRGTAHDGHRTPTRTRPRPQRDITRPARRLAHRHLSSLGGMLTVANRQPPAANGRGACREPIGRGCEAQAQARARQPHWPRLRGSSAGAGTGAGARTPIGRGCEAWAQARARRPHWPRAAGTAWPRADTLPVVSSAESEAAAGPCCDSRPSWWRSSGGGRTAPTRRPGRRGPSSWKVPRGAGSRCSPCPPAGARGGRGGKATAVHCRLLDALGSAPLPGWAPFPALLEEAFCRVAAGAVG